jgi:hypothetical protein
VPGCFTRDLIMEKVKVPITENSYLCFVFEFPPDGPYHLLGYDGLVDNTKFVQHMNLLSLSHFEARNLPKNDFFHCDLMSRSIGHLGGWKNGSKNVRLPRGLGIPVGRTSPNELALLQIHYKNPKKVSEQYDNSGIRVYLSKQMMPMNAGVLTAGTMNIDIPSQASAYQIDSTCILSEMISTPINILSFTPHTHRLGKRVFVEILRSGSTWRIPVSNGIYQPSVPQNATQFWVDENRQSVIMGGLSPPHGDSLTASFEREIPVYPNDTIRTICEYDTMSESKNTFFSFLPEKGEMCEVYFFAYPVNQGKLLCAEVTLPNHVVMVQDEIVRATDMTWVSYNGYIFVIGAWIITSFFYTLLGKIFPKKWKDMTEDQRKACAYYFIPVFIFTGALYFLVNSDLVSKSATLRDLQFGRLSGLIVTCGYMFEMIYRKLRSLLILHHMLTIFLFLYSLEGSYTTGNAGFVRIGAIWLYHALTEPFTFVGLFFHKLSFPSYAMYTLYFAAAQVFLAKMIINGFLVYYWYFDILPLSGLSTWYTANVVIFPIIIGLLGVVQVYDVYVMLMIAEKNRRKVDKPNGPAKNE